MFSRKIRHVAIRSGSIRWISIRFDAESLFIQKGKLISKTDLQKRFVVKEAKKCKQSGFNKKNKKKGKKMEQRIKKNGEKLSRLVYIKHNNFWNTSFFFDLI